MQNSLILSRRGLLGAACCLAASPLVTPVSFAAMPGENRFVTILLRGAMDGLDLVQPHGDRLFAALRPKLALGGDAGLIDLDGFFGLHPEAAALEPLYRSGELGFVHAVSTSYRDVRSHFDGQDFLESGGARGTTGEGGWLNRVLSLTDARLSAVDVSPTREIILSGPNPAEVWSPRSDMSLAEDELQMLARLYRNDPDFSEALTEAVGLDRYTDLLRGDDMPGQGSAATARMAASLLKQTYRIASFSLNGWDTHVNQKGQFKSAVNGLASAVITLKEDLGPAIWDKTAVIAVTEFGRSARENSNGGTDHGTGGCAVIAGGAIRGGKVFGRWPGLDDANLLDQRDLMPTGDVRSVAAALLASQYGISRSALEKTVFPGMQYDGKAAFL